MKHKGGYASTLGADLNSILKSQSWKSILLFFLCIGSVSAATDIDLPEVFVKRIADMTERGAFSDKASVTGVFGLNFTEISVSTISTGVRRTFRPVEFPPPFNAKPQSFLYSVNNQANSANEFAELTFRINPDEICVTRLIVESQFGTGKAFPYISLHPYNDGKQQTDYWRIEYILSNNVTTTKLAFDFERKLCLQSILLTQSVTRK
jgi:hypothetical protein